MAHSLDSDKIRPSGPVSGDGAICTPSQIDPNPAKSGVDIDGIGVVGFISHTIASNRLDLVTSSQWF